MFTEPLPIEGISRIYKIRARYNLENKIGIQGFDHVISSLEKTQQATVVIINVQVKQEVFVIFVDAALQESLGILQGFLRRHPRG